MYCVPRISNESGEAAPKGAKDSASEVKKGITPGGEGPYNGSGGANETLIPQGLPPGSVGPWKKLP